MSSQQKAASWWPWLILPALSVFVFSGCASSRAGSNLRADATQHDSKTVSAEGSDIETVAATTAQPVLFTDRRSLQYDTGQMDPQVPEKFEATSTGLRYRVLRKSDGARPKATDTVTVHYRGWLDDGTVFDSSYDRGQPATFPLDGVVQGWSEGLQYIGEGGMIELWIPGRLGYGAQGSGNIPPNATLHFVVELLEID